MTTTKIITVANQKGGTGKTVLAFHIAHACSLIKADARVLVIDLDAQANLSQYITGDFDIIKKTGSGVGLFLEQKDFNPASTSNPQIDILHAHSELDRYDFDQENPKDDNRYASPYFAEKLRSLCYDYVIIDTPPAVGFRQLAPMCWSDTVLIPTEPEQTGVLGLQNVVSAIEEFISSINPRLKWYCVANRVNSVLEVHQEYVDLLQELYPSQFLGSLKSRGAVLNAMQESPAKPVFGRGSKAKSFVKNDWKEFCRKVLVK